MLAEYWRVRGLVRVAAGCLWVGFGVYSARAGAFVGLGDFDGGHAGGGGGLDAEVGVFEDEAVLGGDAQALGGEEVGLGVGFGVGVVAGADEGVEEVEEVEGFQGFDDGLVGAAGDDCKGNLSVHSLDVFKDLGDGLELRKEVVVEGLLAVGDLLDGHGEVVLAVEGFDGLVGGHAAPGVEEELGEGTVVLGEGLGPGDVVEWHGVGDGAVTVEEVGTEGAGWQGDEHGFSMMAGWWVVGVLVGDGLRWVWCGDGKAATAGAFGLVEGFGFSHVSPGQAGSGWGIRSIGVGGE
jgi:hypothetical protein